MVISVIRISLAHLLFIFPLSTIAVYEAIFHRRYKTSSFLEFSAKDYDGLQVIRSNFKSSGVTLAGYKYSKCGQRVKGVVVIAHGMGGGGHNCCMPFINLLTCGGYYVFAYDARGNDNSEGSAVEGLPQGVICLKDALDHAKGLAEYKDLPFALLGHSWGGYSVGCVLAAHPEIKAAVIVAGFNESEDLLKYESVRALGAAANLFLPYLQLYERLKFGKRVSRASAVKGMERSNAGVLIVHSQNDTTVPIRYGYDKFFKHFGTSARFRFVLYQDKGHTDLLYSGKALAYRAQLKKEYRAFLRERKGRHCGKAAEEFIKGHLDKKKCFEVDPDLMAQILDLFDTYCS